MAIDLLHDDLGRVAREGDRGDIVHAVASVTTWHEELATAIDYLLRQRVVALLRERAPVDDLVAEARMIDTILDPARETEIAAAGRWFDRWRGYEALLSGLASALRLVDPASALEKSHVQEILHHVAARPDRCIRQRQLGDDLGLKPANLTRILQVMEANELIARAAEGNEKLISLGPRAPVELIAAGADARSRRRRSPYLRQLAGLEA